MKKEILILAIATLLTQNVFSQDSLATTASSKESTSAFNFGFGAILATNTSIGNVQGINLKVNKIRNEKHMIGLSADIGRMYETGHDEAHTIGAARFYDLTGIYANLFVTAGYYFLGNPVDSKAGLYGKLGVGAVWYQTTQASTFMGYPEVWTNEYTSFNVSAQLCLGGDVKLGKGRLFAEIVSIPSLYEQVSHKGSVSDSSIPDYPSTNERKSNISNNDFAQQLGCRVGYVLIF